MEVIALSAIAEAGDHRFIRIRKSLIVNNDFISFINVLRQKLVLCDCHTLSHEFSASREALRLLKDVLDGHPLITITSCALHRIRTVSNSFQHKPKEHDKST